jgi:hypothetical protein
MEEPTMKAKFSRLVPFYLVSVEDANDSIGFDAYPVEVEPRTLATAIALRKIKTDMDAMFDTMPAPEEGAQQEAVFFEELITEVLDELNA